MKRLSRVKNAGSTAYGRSYRERPNLLLLAGLALFGLLVLVSCGGGTAGEQRTQESAGDEPQAAVGLDHPSLGDENAPVVLTEYADYQ